MKTESEVDLAALNERLQKLPKISETDPRIQPFRSSGVRPNVERHGGNFYRLWLDLRDNDRNTVSASINNQVSAEFKNWYRFLIAEAAAVTAVWKALDDFYDPFENEVATYGRLLLGEQRYEDYERLNDPISSGHPYGAYSAAELRVWDELNPALQNIGRRMDAHEIPQLKFHG